ncbi:PREDICTED: protein suppressor of white apricot isoform X2 [Rhagoletis zephyria]|uniref:protein suppressor of white apricot isoform X2 n=1 Tax=Rhagoletis zephyria TaxID=28612 RepID=UPI000811654B|nr:PREDICTED: protein suppressor of white apricot isoform X2 [Rhagoletis zephyria]
MSYYNMTRQPVREYAGGSVGGILRKSGSSTSSNNGVYNSYTSTSNTTGLNAGEARQVDLLVFGYACKLFRDDDKARDIDHGKHMIPWMGDPTLKIDRYDVRGALSELAPHEPPPGGYGNRLDYLSAEEQRAEQLCEEERYLYLYNNEEDHILRQEEDLKRLKQDVEGGNYAQVDFQYGNDGVAAVPHGPSREEHCTSPSGEEAEQTFSLPKDFVVPASILLPETMKQHAIIEKTARFIASQGMQMEILLKAKQSNNVQFEFLAINGALNPYYKFILNAIKNGTYPAERLTPPPNEKHETGAASSSTATGHTAHMPTKPVITVPTIKYKPSANCAYTQLISKIKGVPLPAVIDGELANMPTSNSPIPSTAAGANFTPVLLQYNDSTYVSAESEAGEGTTNSNSNSQSNGNVKTEVEVLMSSSALALAQDYASDTESEAEEQQPKTPPPPKFEPVLNFPVPTETLKNIIDKTATYVIKNGRQFEETLRAKSVDRFTFLLYDNEFYPYYLYKVTGDPDAASKEQKQRKAAAVAAALMSKKGLQTAEKAISPVCFSIKPKEESTAAILQPALPHEPSDDDEECTAKPAATGQARSVPEHVQKAIQLVESQLMARNAQIAATVGSRSAANAVMAGPPLLGLRAPAIQHQQQSTGNRFDADYNSSIGGNSTKTQLKISKAEMERNALFEQQQQNRQKELKKAEEKVKDKLAKIAREKLGGPISKEKQLQLERKRKAMAFLNQIKGAPSSASNADQNSTNAEENASDSEESVHSIPITSYGPEDDGKSDEEEKLRLIEIPTTHIAGATPTPAPTNSTLATKDAPKTKSAATVTVSDDDDVQLVGEIKPMAARLSVSKPRKERKRNLRSRARDSSPDATPASSSTARVRKHARRRRSPSPSQSSDDDDSSSSSDSTTSTSSSSSSSTSDSQSTYQSDDSTDTERSRSHRKHKSMAKTGKKPKTRKSSKSRKSASRRARKKKSKKRVRSREDRSIEEYKDYKALECTRERTHNSKRERVQEDAYEREYERRKRHHRSEDQNRQRSTLPVPTDSSLQRRRERMQRSASQEMRREREHEREREREREHERERERDRQHRERRAQRDEKQRERERERECERERERERDRPHTPTRRYDTPARKEKKKKHER